MRFFLGDGGGLGLGLGMGIWGYVCVIGYRRVKTERNIVRSLRRSLPRVRDATYGRRLEEAVSRNNVWLIELTRV